MLITKHKAIILIFWFIIIIVFSLLYLNFINRSISGGDRNMSLMLLDQVVGHNASLPPSVFLKLTMIFIITLASLFCLIIFRFLFPELIKKNIELIIPIIIAISSFTQILYNNNFFSKLIFGTLVALLFFLFIYQFLLRNNQVLSRITKKLPASVFFLVIFIYTSFIFFSKFHITKLNQLIFVDDYPTFLYLAKYQTEMFKHGAIFGWNDYFSGGYPSFLDLRLLSLPFLPFSIFGDHLGFHLMIYIYFIAIPFLVIWLNYELTKSKNISMVSGFLSSFMMQAYFNGMLSDGLIPGFISIVLFILSLISLERFLKRKRFSVLLLVLSLSGMLYIHIYTFIFTIYFLLIRTALEKLINNNRVYFKKILSALFLLFLICLPFLYLLIKYYSYISQNRICFGDQGISQALTNNISEMIKCVPLLPIWLMNSDFLRVAWIVFPIAIFCYLNNSRFKMVSIYFFIFLFFIFTAPLVHFMLPVKIKFLAPVFISLIGGIWVINNNQGVSLLRLSIITLICFFLLNMNSLISPLKHVQSIDTFNPKLINEISRLDGNLILLENVAHLNPFIGFDKEPTESPYPHFEGIIGLATNKKFLSHYGSDPYPYFKFKDGLIVNGAMCGDYIKNMDPLDLTQTLENWGVRYVIMWSKDSKEYFNGFKQAFEKIFDDNHFNIFRVKGSVGLEMMVKQGSGKVISLSPFHKQASLMGVVKGDLVILRRNYFPEWKAFYADKELKLFDTKGQLSFICPNDGSIKIDLYFPKYSYQLFISILAILILFILSFKNFI